MIRPTRYRRELRQAYPVAEPYRLTLGDVWELVLCLAVALLALAACFLPAWLS